MKKTFTMTGLVVAGCLAGWIFGSEGTARAQNFQEYFIGADWGTLRGSMGNRLLLFEDTEGTVRIVDPLDVDPATKLVKVERVLRRK